MRLRMGNGNNKVAEVTEHSKKKLKREVNRSKRVANKVQRPTGFTDWDVEPG